MSSIVNFSDLNPIVTAHFKIGTAMQRAAQAFTTDLPANSYTSTSVVRVIEEKLHEPGIDRVTGERAHGYSLEYSADVAARYARQCLASGGTIVNSARVSKALVARVTARIPNHYQGNLQGQVDYEDQFLIATALMVKEMASADALTLWTFDEGIQNIKAQLAFFQIRVLVPGTVMMKTAV